MDSSSILLAVDEEGYLIRYDLSESGAKGAIGKDIIQIHSTVHRIWGSQKGRIAILELGDTEKHQLLFLDLEEKEEPRLLEDLPEHFEIDNISGTIVEPSICAAILESSVMQNNNGTLTLHPNEKEEIVYRNLSHKEWLIFCNTGIIGGSTNFQQYLS